MRNPYLNFLRKDHMFYNDEPLMVYEFYRFNSTLIYIIILLFLLEILIIITKIRYKLHFILDLRSNGYTNPGSDKLINIIKNKEAIRPTAFTAPKI